MLLQHRNVRARSVFFLTAPGCPQIIRTVRKAVVLAALAAAVIGFGLATPAEARASSHRTKHRASHSTPKKRSSRKVVIRQRPSGEVVLDRATPGPYFPPTYYNY